MFDATKMRSKSISSQKRDILSKPVEHFEVEKYSGVGDVIEAFQGTSFQSRRLASCLRVLTQMVTDKDRPLIFMGLAGAMVPGGLRRVVRDMMKYHLVDVLVSTGANLFHDLAEAIGFHHYIQCHRLSDTRLQEMKIDRIYDTYADEEEFQKTDRFLMGFIEKMKPGLYSSREFLRLLGMKLHDENSVLRTGVVENIPIFSPAINDSSLGMALAAYRLRRKKQDVVIIDSIKDNLEILELKRAAKKSAAIYIGGGVPKNFIQQIHPMAVISGMRVRAHDYGIQITTDDPKWGGLSGCTLEESVSWGKLTREASHETVYMDATIGLPLLFKALMEKKELWYPRKPFEMKP